MEWSTVAYFSNLFQGFKEHYCWSSHFKVIVRPMCVWSIGEIVFQNADFEILVVFAPHTGKQYCVKCHVGFQQHLSSVVLTPALKNVQILNSNAVNLCTIRASSRYEMPENSFCGGNKTF